MITIAISDDAATKLRSLLDEEDVGAYVRIREYTTGSPCCLKKFLGLTIDEKNDEDVEGKAQDMAFVLEEDLVDQFGEKYSISLCDQKSFVVNAE